MHNFKLLKSVIAIALIFISPMLFAQDFTVISEDDAAAAYENFNAPFAKTPSDKKVDKMLESIGFTVLNPYKKAPNFILDDIDGNQVNFNQLPGALRVMNCWANWCPSCKEEKPSFQKFYEKMNGQDYSLITVHYKGTNSEVKQYMQQNGLTFPVVIDVDGSKVGTPWGIKSLPTSLVIDGKGYIRGKIVGKAQWNTQKTINTFKDMIKELNNPNPGPDPEPQPDPNSCVGNCGGKAPGGCYCDSSCEYYGDCCSDKKQACGY